MGNESSKKSQVDLISPEEKSLILKFFGDVTQSQVESVWASTVHPKLAESAFKHMSNEYKTVNLNSLIKFYTDVSRGSNELLATIILRLMCSANDCDSDEASVSSLITFVEIVVLSYLKILQLHNIPVVRHWDQMKVVNCDDTSHKLSEYFVKDWPPSKEGRVTAHNLEKSLNRAWAFNLMFQTCMKSMFGTFIPERIKPLLPDISSQHEKEFTFLNFSHLLFIHSSLPVSCQQKWRLLYSSNLQGYSWSTMLACIMDRGPTVIVIEDHEGNIFGGFAPSSWKTSPKFFGDESTFLFILKPKFEKFDITGFNDHYQYCNTGQQTLPNGLGIGGQFYYWGLFIDSNFGLGKVSESCSTFKNYYSPCKANEFQIKQLEVWAVNEKLPDLEFEGSGSVLDNNLEVEALLEMAGRSQHSKGLREDPNL